MSGSVSRRHRAMVDSACLAGDDGTFTLFELKRVTVGNYSSGGVVRRHPLRSTTLHELVEGLVTWLDDHFYVDELLD